MFGRSDADSSDKGKGYKCSSDKKIMIKAATTTKSLEFAQGFDCFSAPVFSATVRLLK